MDFDIYSESVYGLTARLQEREWAPGLMETTGMVPTFAGIVEVDARQWRDGEYSLFTIILRGDRYRARVGRYYRPRYLATLARRFSEQAARLSHPAPAPQEGAEQ